MSAVLGIFFHALGGFAAGSFYIPMKLLKKWSWESGWLILGLAAWIIAPWVAGWLTIPDLWETLTESPGSSLFWSYFFGLLWGIGGLTFGLTMRYLGLSLGMALALGLTAAFGTLIPPIYEGTFAQLLETRAGLITFAGVIICLAGIAICGWAGARKEKEVDEVQKKEGVAEFDLWKGIGVAIVAGILSACFAFGLQAGAPIAESALDKGAAPLFQNNAALVVILAGGITTNFIWCAYLNITNGSASDYTNQEAPLRSNYLWASLGGITWYLQFFFYGMGTTQLGERFDFASWTIHMAFIILFSNLWGLFFREWAGVSKKTLSIQIFGLFIILFSTILIGMGSQF
jgi:L-rhamnose-H+ transport protein